MSYVDGFVLAVPAANREAYREHAAMFAGLFKAQGALNVVECWGDDVPPGKLTSFPLAVKCEPGEVVVFSWVTWPSRAVRDAAWKTLREEPSMQDDAGANLFDGKRLIYGGFEVLLNL